MKILKKFWLLVALCMAIVAFNACDNEPDLPIGDPTVEIGVEIDGIVWATRNVGTPGTFAARPESAGMFYQWNRRTAWSSSGSISDWDASPAEGTEWEAENDPCPSGWRVPTRDELNSLRLLPESRRAWITVNGVEGKRFGCDNHNIFLPAAGYRGNRYGMLLAQGREKAGAYWSSTERGSSHPEHAVELFFQRARVVMFVNYHRAFAYPIRCVRK